MNYRFKEDINVIQLPKGLEEENRLGCKQPCCPEMYALDSDFVGYAYRKADPTDLIEFTVTKCGESGTLPLYGTDGVFPNDNLAVGFMFDWQQYYTNYGSGKYTISVSFTIQGISGGFDIADFKLMPYSIANAMNTVYIESEYRSKDMASGIDYTSSNFATAIRFRGLFGEMQPNSEGTELITKGFRVEKTKREYLQTYSLETDPTNVTVTRHLLDMLLKQDYCFITDHNARNHDYSLFEVPVFLKETPEMNYRRGSRMASLSAKFGDRDLNKKTYFNG